MKRIKVIVPIPMDEAGVSGRAKQLLTDTVRTGFQPEFDGVSSSAALADFTDNEGNGRTSASVVTESAAYDEGMALLNNRNPWRVRDGKFQEVYVYMRGANVLV
jgi:hypothetical protein